MIHILYKITIQIKENAILLYCLCKYTTPLVMLGGRSTLWPIHWLNLLDWLILNWYGWKNLHHLLLGHCILIVAVLWMNELVPFKNNNNNNTSHYNLYKTIFFYYFFMLSKNEGKKWMMIVVWRERNIYKNYK